MMLQRRIDNTASNGHRSEEEQVDEPSNRE